MSRTIVVLGATGVVGSGVVKHFLKLQDTVVIAPVRGAPTKLFDAIGKENEANGLLRVPNADYATREG